MSQKAKQYTDVHVDNQASPTNYELYSTFHVGENRMPLMDYGPYPAKEDYRTGIIGLTSFRNKSLVDLSLFTYKAL